MIFYTVSIFSSWIILTIWTSQCSRLELIIGEKGGKGGRKRGGKKGERRLDRLDKIIKKTLMSQFMLLLDKESGAITITKWCCSKASLRYHSTKAPEEQLPATLTAAGTLETCRAKLWDHDLVLGLGSKSALFCTLLRAADNMDPSLPKL